MRVAIVHDDLLQWGGAERVVKAISEIWPKAPIFTSVADPNIKAKHFPKTTIVESPIKYIPYIGKMRRMLFPVYPLGFRSYDLSKYDLIVSSTTRFAHTVPLKNGTVHVSYCHTPPRYFWEFDQYMANEKYASLKRLLIKPSIKFFQNYDVKSAHQVHSYIANSHNTAKKIVKLYNKKSVVIPPFIDEKVFSAKSTVKKEDYFLLVTRLLPWKRVDIAIEAAKKLGLKLLIIGKGPDEKRLKELAKGGTIEFLNDLTDKQLAQYYRKSRAFLATQEEDFGMSIIEAQACGTPVIAYGRGGALEAIIKDKTGVYFHRQTASSLIKALQHFDPLAYFPEACRAHALQFSKTIFQEKLESFITSEYNLYSRNK